MSAKIMNLTMKGFAKELLEMAETHGDLPMLIDVDELKEFLPILGCGVLGMKQKDTDERKKVFVLSTGIDAENTMQSMLFQELERRDKPNEEKTQAEGSITA